METMAAGSPPTITTVAASARSCSESFQNCLNKAAKIHHRELSFVEDQHARFAIWAANIRVFSAGRDSLDHRLREASDVQDVVIGLLQALDYKIQSCSKILEPIAEKTQGEVPEKPQEEILAKTQEEVLEKVPEDLNQAIEAISKELTLLHKFTNTIRRASKEKQNVEAEKSFKIKDEEGNDAEPFIRQLFSNQIRDRFPGVSDNIQQRLANSMVLRRKRILYRRKRYDKKPIRPPELPLPPRVSAPKVKPNVGVQRQPIKQQTVPAPTPSTVPSVPQTARTLVAEKFQQAAAPSVISVSKTVALSSHDQLQFPPAPCGALMKRYRRFKKDQEEQLKVTLGDIPGYFGPKAPPAPGARDAVRKHRASHKQTLDDYWDDCLRAVGEVVCQFCFYALPVRDVVQESKWRLHVKNDLDPYVCLFQECNSPETLYNHSDAWIKHMKQHAMRWRCTSKSHPAVVCDTKDKYIDHMKTSHGGKFNDAQLNVLADRSGRATGPLFTSCPLCGVEEVKGGMEEHIVGHMRFLALKSLPATKEEELDDDSGSDDSAAKPHSRSTIDNDRERYTPFDPDDLFHLLNSNRQHDESIDFIDETIFADVPDDEWRLFEWGFIPSSHGTDLDYNSDPIVLAFLFSATGMRSTGEVDSAGRPTFWADPDCAICLAPASVLCDCEAKGLDLAINQQEHRIFEPMRKRARTWVRAKARNFIYGEFKTYVESEDFKTYVKGGESAAEDKDAASGLSRQETNEAWAANVFRYPETIEHFFSLVEYTLPSDGEPAVTDPKPRPPHSIFPRPRGTRHRHNYREKPSYREEPIWRSPPSSYGSRQSSRASSPGNRSTTSSPPPGDPEDSTSANPGTKPTDQPTSAAQNKKDALSEGDEPAMKHPPPRSNSRPQVLGSRVEDNSVDNGSESYTNEIDEIDDNSNWDAYHDENDKTKKDDGFDSKMEGLDDVAPFSSDNPRSSHAELPKPTIKVSPLRTSNSSAPYQREPGEGKRPSSPPRPTRHRVSYVEDAEEPDYSDSIPANTGSKRSSGQGRYQQGDFFARYSLNSSRYTSDGHYDTEDARDRSAPVPNYGVGRERHYNVQGVQYSEYPTYPESTKGQSPHDSALDRPNDDRRGSPSSPDRLDENQEDIEEKAGEKTEEKTKDSREH
ncbi:hypothetical protein CEP53_002420 [Fusarium sp. AF-6]|nr:hypothetical protein CEP53_002420 [Fusarium sp. AF-6]